MTETPTIKFLIMEQYDGRYIVVVLAHGDWGRTETLLRWEDDCRSTSKCYSEVAEYMVESGNYLDYTATIQYVRR